MAQATYQDILTAVEFNDAMRIRQGKFFCAQSYYGYDPLNQCLIQPGDHPTTINRKYDDIAGALVVGGLACTTTLNGFDAIIPKQGQLRPAELKNSEKERSQYWCGPKYGVFTGKNYKGKTEISSDFNASYELVNNLASKQVDTYLSLRDKKTNELIDCRMMDANTIHTLLLKKFTQAQDKAIAANRKFNTSQFSVKWCEFQEIGSRVETREKTIGFLEYKNQIIEPYRLGLIPTMPTN